MMPPGADGSRARLAATASTSRAVVHRRARAAQGVIRCSSAWIWAAEQPARRGGTVPQPCSSTALACAPARRWGRFGVGSARCPRDRMVVAFHFIHRGSSFEVVAGGVSRRQAQLSRRSWPPESLSTSSPQQRRIRCQVRCRGLGQALAQGSDRSGRTVPRTSTLSAVRHSQECREWQLRKSRFRRRGWAKPALPPCPALCTRFRHGSVCARAAQPSDLAA